MPNKNLGLEDQKMIGISSELYDDLRCFCDNMGIRFVDFIEESLASATRRDELEKLLNDEAKVKERIKYKSEAAYLDGFARGVLVALLAAGGRLQTSQDLTPSVIQAVPRYQVVTGEQMELFKS